MHKLNKGISAPLGVIFGVLLAIILVILAVFIAFNISTTAVKSQAGQLVVVGQPVAFYDTNSNELTKITFVVKNPTGSNITITGFILKGTTFTLTGPQEIKYGATATIIIDDDDFNVTIGTWENSTGFTPQSISGAAIDLSNEVAQGYLEIILITDRGTTSIPIQIVKVGG